ncbi:MAG: Y4bD/Y4pK family protein [Chloroflexi bacterium]|nr:Y4bD/Y4pK family protein [Chloroflexota bacterium]MBU1662518.1 Y4bD/Y4pK family protein [Chloroflexota bacterium]
MSTPLTTPLANGEVETFQVTHPFHPLSGKVFELVTQRCNWGENRVYYHDEAGILCSIPQAWTSLAPVDPFVKLAGGRSAFRVTDLLELTRLVAYLTKEHDEGCDA